MNTAGYLPEQRGNPDGLKSLAKYARLPLDRIQYFPDSDPSLIAAIGRGILFVMAFWSGSSVKAFSQLTDVIHRGLHESVDDEDLRPPA